MSNEPIPGFIVTTKSKPCPLCQRFGWCLIAKDGHAALCQRVESKKKWKGAGWYHVLDASIKPVYIPTKKPEKPKTDSRWSAEAIRYAANIDPTARGRLAIKLGLPESGLNCITLIGWRDEKASGCFTFPENDGDGKIIGLNRRYESGEKKVIAGGERGITLPTGWNLPTDQPLWIVEGPTDAAGLTAAGLKAIGRPSNSGGVAHLARAIKAIPSDRTVIVIGENDERYDKILKRLRCPGLEGATSVAVQLAELLPHRIEWAMPPVGYKDARDYLTSKNHGNENWHNRGKDFAYIVRSESKPAATTIDEYKAELELRQNEFDFESDSWGIDTPIGEILSRHSSGPSTESDLSALFQ